MLGGVCEKESRRQESLEMWCGCCGEKSGSYCNATNIAEEQFGDDDDFDLSIGGIPRLHGGYAVVTKLIPNSTNFMHCFQKHKIPGAIYHVIQVPSLT